MESRTIPGLYVWEPPDKAISIRLSLDVVDRMQQDVMKGFGAVPKRGAEVGGILLGRSTAGEKTVVTIDDYVQVPIEYKRGPSYLLSAEDAHQFEAAVERSRSNPDPLLRPIGYFRSHTRDGVGLGAEDLAIVDLHFPAPETVALVIKPYATKVSQAGFYFREDGKFPEGPPVLEFPFRRKDLDPESPAPVRTARPPERTQERAAPRVPPRGRAEHRPLGFDPAAYSGDANDSTAALKAELLQDSKRKGQSAWIWVPLSFVFSLTVSLAFTMTSNLKRT